MLRLDVALSGSFRVMSCVVCGLVFTLSCLAPCFVFGLALSHHVVPETSDASVSPCEQTGVQPSQASEQFWQNIHVQEAPPLEWGNGWAPR
jgi:hypothetical protein